MRAVASKAGWLALGLSALWHTSAGAEPRAGSDSAPAPPPVASAPRQHANTKAEPSAEALLRRGIERRKAGDDRAALADFELAYQLGKSAQALAQVALAEQALGRWVEAHEHLQSALNERTDEWVRAHRATLELALGEIASRLGRIDVFCNVNGAAVQLDERMLGHTPLREPLPVVAGQSVLSVSAPGYFEVTRHVQVDASGLARVDVRLTPIGASNAKTEPPEASPAAAALPPQDTTRSLFLYTSVGLAALGVTVGVTGYVMREVNVTIYNDDDRCRRRPGIRRSEECNDEWEAWRRGETLAIVGFASAAVFGGVGLYLWLDRPRPEQALLCNAGVSAVSCGWRF